MFASLALYKYNSV